MDEKVDPATVVSTPLQGEPVVRVWGLVKKYGRRQAVKGIDLDVHQGEIPKITFPPLFHSIRRSIAKRKPYKCPTGADCEID